MGGATTSLTATFFGDWRFTLHLLGKSCYRWAATRPVTSARFTHLDPRAADSFRRGLWVVTGLAGLVRG